MGNFISSFFQSKPTSKRLSFFTVLFSKTSKALLSSLLNTTLEFSSECVPYDSIVQNYSSC